MWIERAEKKLVTLTRTVKSLLEKSMMKQSESVYWPTCVFWLVFPSLAYQGEFHVCFNSPQAIGLSSYPQQSSEWAQLPHGASVMSKVAGPLLHDLLSLPGVWLNMRPRVWLFVLRKDCCENSNVSMWQQCESALPVVASGSLLPAMPSSRSEERSHCLSLFFKSLPLIPFSKSPIYNDG